MYIYMTESIIINTFSTLQYNISSADNYLFTLVCMY